MFHRHKVTNDELKQAMVSDPLVPVQADVAALQAENVSMRKEIKSLKTAIGKLETEQRRLTQRKSTW